MRRPQRPRPTFEPGIGQRAQKCHERALIVCIQGHAIVAACGGEVRFANRSPRGFLAEISLASG